MGADVYTHDASKTVKDCTIAELQKSIKWCNDTINKYEESGQLKGFVIVIKQKLAVAKAELANRIGRK